MDNFEKLVMILKEARLEKEYSFRQVEMYLNHKGVKYNFTSLKKLEDGKIRSISPRVLHTLAEIYGLNAVELFKMADFLDKNYEIERVHFIDYKMIGVSSFEYVQFNDIQELYDATELYNHRESDTYVIKMMDQSMQGLEKKNIPDGSENPVVKTVQHIQKLNEHLFYGNFAGSVFLTTLRAENSGGRNRGVAVQTAILMVILHFDSGFLSKIFFEDVFFKKFLPD